MENISGFHVKKVEDSNGGDISVCENIIFRMQKKSLCNNSQTQLANTKRINRISPVQTTLTG